MTKEKKTKRIGILTSGGDCPGLNGVIRAVLQSATEKGWQVYGIPHSTNGFVYLAENKYQPEDFRLEKHGYDLSGFLKIDVLQFMSGSVLGSLNKEAKTDQEREEQEKLTLEGYRKAELDALIVIGGDGSIDIIQNYARAGGWNLIAIPKTIDNDVPKTQSVGFDTACNIVTKCIYDLTFTAASHDRVMIAEVMGRDAGHLALNSGIAGGADIILIPEKTPYLTEEIVRKCCEKILQLRREDRKFALVVIAEGVKNYDNKKEKHIGDYLEKLITEYAKKLCLQGSENFCEIQDLDVRVSVLGHLQRTGTPSFFDRILGANFGVKAVELIEKEQYDKLLTWQNNQVIVIELQEILETIKKARQAGKCAAGVTEEMLDIARKLGIYVGD